MHELSLANRLVALAEETARQANAKHVRVVTLRVGTLSGVAVDALRFAYDIATAGTLLAGSRLQVQTVPVVVYCPRCQRASELPSVQRFRCPVCDTPTADIRAGRELEIETIEVE